MKTRLFLLLLFPVAAVTAQNGMGPRTGQRDGMSPSNACPRDGTCPVLSVSATNPTTLNAPDLVAAIDEERVAQDLYRAAARRWSLPVFSNIAAAEARHAGVFEQLAASANVTLPPAQDGVYGSEEAQRLYEQLLPLMNGSQAGALKAGALIEETNIVDLRWLRQRASDEPTQAVLSQLERASMQHLRAFVRNLQMLGETYEPQILSAADFSVALAGGMNGGRGWGPRASR